MTLLFIFTKHWILLFSCLFDYTNDIAGGTIMNLLQGDTNVTFILFVVDFYYNYRGPHFTHWLVVTIK